MKKSTAISSFLFLSSLGSLSYLAAQVLNLSLHFSLEGEEGHHYH